MVCWVSRASSGMLTELETMPLASCRRMIKKDDKCEDRNDISDDRTLAEYYVRYSSSLIALSHA